MTATAVFERYLALLDIPAAPPDLQHLTLLVGAQLMRVPFENVSKLYLKKRFGAKRIPSMDQHLDGIERYNFGGTCYPNNVYFCELLRHLGYDATLCGADMAAPDVHIVTMVRLEGREYLVDVGYAAPFSMPLPRDLEGEHAMSFGAYRYILSAQDASARSRMTVFRDGEKVHGYLAKPEARTVSYFENVIRDSYRDAATFMNAVVVERFSPGKSLRIHNLLLTKSTPESTSVTRLADRDDLIKAIEHYGPMPADIVRDAIDGISLTGDIYS